MAYSVNLCVENWQRRCGSTIGELLEEKQQEYEMKEVNVLSATRAGLAGLAASNCSFDHGKTVHALG